jgi:RNA polymerase sigma factor (sigma-70 family)
VGFHEEPPPGFQRLMGETFEALVEAHHAEIHRYLRRLTFGRSDADDLSQETFLRAYRAWRGLPPDANVRAWLFAIATNLFRNHFRGERRRSRAYAAVRARGPDRDEHGPDGALAGTQTRAVIDGVITRLPLKQRMAFVLRKIHDLDYDAIGRSLDCSADSARAHVFQALRKIRQTLDGQESIRTEVQR